MQIRVFSAPRLHEALAEVRKCLGPDALIIDRRQITDAGGARRWEVFAARDAAPESGPEPVRATAPQADIHQAMRRLERIVEELGNRESASLRQALDSDTERRAFDRLIELGIAPSHAFDLAPQFVEGEGLAERQLKWAPALTRPGRLKTLLFTGPSGSGKTTLIAKLATHFSLRGWRVALATTDTERVGGTDLLETYAATLGLALSRIREPRDARKARQGAKSAQLLLVDSEGWSPRHDASLARQQRLWEPLGIDRRFLVLPANFDEEDGMQMIARQARIDATDLAFTKLDETGRPGKIVNWGIASGLALSWCSFGPEVPEQTGWLSPEALKQLLAGNAEMRGASA